jgi:hypothetical protein
LLQISDLLIGALVKLRHATRGKRTFLKICAKRLILVGSGRLAQIRRKGSRPGAGDSVT